MHLPPQLQRFELPAPSVGDGLRDVRSTLDLLGLAPAHITFALLASVWREVMTAADFALHLAGATGVSLAESPH